MRRTVLPGDEDYFRRLETTGSTGALYRQRGQSLSPEQYHASLWAGVLTQNTVVDDVSGAPVGLLCCYGPDFRNGHASLAVIFDESRRGTAWAMRHMYGFIDELFVNFPFRKLYAEVAEFNLGQLNSFPSKEFVEIEGRKIAHEYHDGQYWDLFSFAIHRERWITYRQKLTDEGVRAVEIVDAIFIARTGAPLDQVPGEELLSDLGLDSLDLAEITEALDGMAPHDVPSDLYESLATTADVKHFLKEWGLATL